jgi:hypothetical protein
LGRLENWDWEAVRAVGESSCELIWGVWEGVWKIEGFGDSGSVISGELEESVWDREGEMEDLLIGIKWTFGRAADMGS